VNPLFFGIAKIDNAFDQMKLGFDFRRALGAPVERRRPPRSFATVMCRQFTTALEF
jgi:hypothetical protein